jgi:hypothetical protein
MDDSVSRKGNGRNTSTEDGVVVHRVAHYVKTTSTKYLTEKEFGSAGQGVVGCPVDGMSLQLRQLLDATKGSNNAVCHLTRQTTLNGHIRKRNGAPIRMSEAKSSSIAVRWKA